jgi:hypothetical protein
MTSQMSQIVIVTKKSSTMMMAPLGAALDMKDIGAPSVSNGFGLIINI